MQSYEFIMTKTFKPIKSTSYNEIYMPVVLICVETIWLGS